jgi:hypothetical protein
MNEQQVKRSDSHCSVLASAIHYVTGCATMIERLIAICNLRA